jgi:sarcosine oxidase subunit alpha
MAEAAPRGTVRITIDDVTVECDRGTSVAAALLNRGGPAAWHVRTSVTGMPRGPLCGMGVCFECRATIDGQPHQRTCQLPVRDGMEVRTRG